MPQRYGYFLNICLPFVVIFSFFLNKHSVRDAHAIITMNSSLQGLIFERIGLKIHTDTMVGMCGVNIVVIAA